MLHDIGTIVAIESEAILTIIVRINTKFIMLDISACQYWALQQKSSLFKAVCSPKSYSSLIQHIVYFGLNLYLMRFSVVSYVMLFMNFYLWLSCITCYAYHGIR